MPNLDFNYEFINDEDKIAIVEAQAKGLESEHFTMSLIEPSPLQNTDAHAQWKSQMMGLESAIMRVREMMDIVLSRSGADLDLVNDEYLLKMREEE
tara:strand:+ start:4990 stop:5277 length:288 start_codon:yes stop_codon:yes gene_type:complete